MSDILITPPQLARFAPHCAAAAEIAPLLDAEAQRCQINTGLRISHWMAQMFVESAGFTRLVENLNYSIGALIATWPSRFPTPAAAQPFAWNPERLANHVYGGRMGNRPEDSGDGWLYRGRGFLMRTGRTGYSQAAAFTGLDLVHQPDLLLQHGPAAKDAADYWRCSRVNGSADADDINAVTKAVNGGLIGLAERKAAFDRARMIWPR